MANHITEIGYTNAISRDSKILGLTYTQMVMIMLIVVGFMVLYQFAEELGISNINEYRFLVVLVVLIAYISFRFIPDKYFTILYLQKILLKNKLLKMTKTPRL